ncbi:MAG: hypothetical protein JW841_01820 [Deltaproteobacteria bacterium]|nr:hypothetical protein [Deltaproteobacteria bacterium]
MRSRVRAIAVRDFYNSARQNPKAILDFIQTRCIAGSVPTTQEIDSFVAKQNESEAIYGALVYSAMGLANNYYDPNRLKITTASERKGYITTAQVRSWYSHEVKKINTSGPLTRETAERVTSARNMLKQQAREMMADREVAVQLAKDKPLRPIEYYVEKYSQQGFHGEALWKRIIHGSKTPNVSINKKYGVH